MSSYKNIIVFIFLGFFIVGCTSLNTPQLTNENLIKKEFKYKAFEHENKFVMFALEFDKQGNKQEARELYKSLFEKTSKDEYLYEYIKLSFYLRKYDEAIKIIQSNKEKILTKKLEIKKVYILCLMQVNSLEEALFETNKLLKLEDTSKNYELLGNIYIQKGDYKKAKELYSKLYKKELDENILINLVNVMYLYLDEKKEAVTLLESQSKMTKCSKAVCSKLLAFYQEEKNIDGIVSVLRRMYYKAKEEKDDFAISRVYKLLMYYLEKKDISEVISFLEQSNADNEKLLNLYRTSNKYDKAYALVNKLYKESSNIEYLGQIAMIEFEMTENKKEVLDDVIKKFKEVLIVLDNHVYQNYLGYILIDFDIDIKSGIAYVKKALEKSPNNLAYLDSLAWGQYKLKDCKNAYINMKKVVDQAGLSDKEIIEHWEKIKECNK